MTYLQLLTRVVLFFVVCQFHITNCNRVQYLEFFMNRNCTGKSHVFHETSQIGRHTWFAKETKSIKAVGVWQIVCEIQDLDVDEFPHKIVIEVSTNGIEKSCKNLNVTSSTAIDTSEEETIITTYTNVYGTGSPEMDKIQLGIYTEKEYEGRVYEIDETYSMGDPIRIKSFAFTGNCSWRVFEKTGFTGQWNCLKTHPSVSQHGYGITYAVDVNLIVGSVSKDCDCVAGVKVRPTKRPSTQIPEEEIIIIEEQPVGSESNGGESDQSEDKEEQRGIYPPYSINTCSTTSATSWMTIALLLMVAFALVILFLYELNFAKKVLLLQNERLLA